MSLCCVCKQNSLECIIDFGQQPVSHHYLYTQKEAAFTYAFQLGMCTACGLVQLINPPSMEETKPLFSWISFSEPENHLDWLVEKLSQLPGVTTSSQFCGVSVFEDSLLERLNKKNFLRTDCLTYDKNLGNATHAVIKTISLYAKHQNLSQLFHDRPHVLIIRDILEHAHDPLSFMQTIKEIVDPDGYVVFEIPDYQRTFISCDYSTLWEEHIIYFTPYTFETCLKRGGFMFHSIDSYAYDAQDYLIAIVKPSHQMESNVIHDDQDALFSAQQLMMHYAERYSQQKNWFKNVLSQYQKQGKIALLGAGHLGCHFVNLMDVQHLIDFLVDDHPHKRGMFMPGSRLPVVSSSILDEEHVMLCLLSLNQESEKNFIEKNKKFIERGGTFASIFPS